MLGEGGPGQISTGLWGHGSDATCPCDSEVFGTSLREKFGTIWRCQLEVGATGGLGGLRAIRNLCYSRSPGHCLVSKGGGRERSGRGVGGHCKKPEEGQRQLGAAGCGKKHSYLLGASWWL